MADPTPQELIDRAYAAYAELSQVYQLAAPQVIAELDQAAQDAFLAARSAHVVSHFRARQFAQMVPDVTVQSGGS